MTFFGFFINNQICLYHYLCQNKLKNIAAVKDDLEEGIVHNLENKDDLEESIVDILVYSVEK